MRTATQVKNWINGGWKADKYARNRLFWYGYRRGIDQDGYYGFQCKDLVNAYAIWMGKPFTAGNAESLWRVVQPGWKRISATSAPKQGDVFVMWYSAGGVEYGHTGLVNTATSTSFTSLDQNWFHSSLHVGSPPAFVVHPRDSRKVQYGIRGYLRPTLATTTPTYTYYTVVSGDSLGKIATKYSTTVSQLVSWNKTKYPTLATNPNAIQIGWKLRVK